MSGASTMERGGTSTENGFSRILATLRKSPLVPLLVVGAAIIAIVIALLLWAQSPSYRVLYTNLSEADGGRIISELDSRGVPYEFSAGGKTLLVPSDQVHKLRLQLAEQGLPEGGNVGFELMDNQAFGISQFAEQINFQRSLEGELAHSIESLGPVARARIHLAMAKPSVFVRERKPAKASVVLTLQPGRSLNEGQVSAIVHMVSSSVPDLTADMVTLVDQRGRLLSSEDKSAGGLSTTQLDYIAEVERSYQRRIQNILEPILGMQNVHAQVAAQVDFSQREETSERYGPNQSSERAAVRSAQQSLSYRGGDGLPEGGVPGALTNTPPTTLPSPIQTEGEENAQDANTQQDKQPPDDVQRDSVINYEVDRNVAHVQYQRGRIERLSAAVVVDYRHIENEEGEAQQIPLAESEIAQIERLVRQAMGYSEARGDDIAVVNQPFRQKAVEAALEPAWWQSPELQRLGFTLGRYLLVTLVFLMLYWLLLRPFIKRYTQAATQAQGFQASVGEDETVGESSGALSGQADDADEMEDELYEPTGQPSKVSAHARDLEILQNMAQEDPRMVAMIIRGWIHDDA
ncbi:flagellar basal body M-ring protein FliF [Pistricoccus aurantiacus]|uniref:Flagellar M-ring protein n=1 Tax=Pistricoccus aurantiacus TaxID=1883414 RepID=A0A5B8SSM7_9GAMM|nr:flagellar basal-body MS-ring/collar protein FliF [Pistricoccus aurantiacus]QEA39706.1 flagellar basal body M-ring protein FliF [Pistricoccus aurantiacus]